VGKDSPAAQAGLRSGDRLLGVEGGPAALTLPQQLALALETGEPLGLVVGRSTAEGGTEELSFEIRPRPRSGPVLIGVTPLVRTVGALRPSAVTDGIDLRPGDIVRAVDGRPILRARDWVAALEGGAGPVRLEIERQGRELRIETRPLGVDERTQLARDVALTQSTEHAQVNVLPGSAAARAGLRDGDLVRRVDGAPIEAWEQVFDHSRQAVKRGGALTFTVQREPAGGEAAFVDVLVEPAAIESVEYGLGLAGATYVYKTGSLGEALSFGTSACWRFLQDTWLTLKSMLFGRVSADNIGGPIMIAVVSHTMAELGLVKFFFFLCILSINLALINVLPIPLLDGGHLLFLLIEKIKGSPVSERVMSYSQLVGMVLIATLFVFVIFNDLQRFLGRMLG
jgi:regulator of sigma E protease